MIKTDTLHFLEAIPTQAMDAAEEDVLAYKTFPKAHRTKLHSTNTLERLNLEAKRHADFVGIFPNESSIIRLIVVLLLEAGDEWSLQHRYISLKPFNDLTPTVDEGPTLLVISAELSKIPHAVAWLITPSGHSNFHNWRIDHEYLMLAARVRTIPVLSRIQKRLVELMEGAAG